MGIGILACEAFALLAALGLFASLKAEFARLEKTVESAREQERASARQLESRILQIEIELSRLAAERTPANRPGAARIMNRETKRESIRLVRGGESQEKIARVVGVSQDEIELLRMVAGRLSSGASVTTTKDGGSS